MWDIWYLSTGESYIDDLSISVLISMKYFIYISEYQPTKTAGGLSMLPDQIEHTCKVIRIFPDQ